MVKYDEKQIQVLEGLEPVRKRPGMYIGGVDFKGLHHLVWEIVDNSIDEALAGFCNKIDITIEKDQSVTISDNGRGIPTGINQTTGKSTVETILTVLHAGGKFDGSGYKVSGGLHGVGASVVNALSDFLKVTVKRDGKIFTQEFQKGIPIFDLKQEGTTSETGTTINFLPSPDIFKETTTFDFDFIKERLKQLSFLNKKLELNLEDKNTNQKETFYAKDGIINFIEEKSKNKKPIISKPIFIEQTKDNINLELVLTYYDSDKLREEDIVSFANNIHTKEGGTHEIGFKSALLKTLNKYALNNGLIKKDSEKFQGEDVRIGALAIISIKHPDPLFEGQTKHKLVNAEVRTIVDKIFSEEFNRFLLENPEEAKIIIEKAIRNKLARTKMEVYAKFIKEELKEDKNAISSLAGKLADCSSNNFNEREIYIVEGDSAGGSAKQGRDRSYQAILPLRGKVINVEKSNFNKIMQNNEIRTMITALGCGINEDINLENLRYSKVVIMTDADVDGAHIRTLLLTFFYKFMRPIIENGNLYIAQPPLYKISKGKNKFYVYSDTEKEEIISQFSSDEKFQIQRYKGLGEMNPEEIKTTTMEREGRMLLKVTIEEAKQTSEIFEILMGSEVAPRKEFIQKNAKYADNIDI